MIKLLALLLALAAPSVAQNSSAYDSLTLSTTTGRARRSTSGFVTVSASSATASTYTIRLEGPSGSVKASSFTATYGVVAATGVFSGTVTAQAYALSGGGNIMTTASTDTVTATKTSVAPAVFNSSITIGGGVFGTVNASSRTQWTSNFSLPATMGPCVPGSTVTLRTQNVPIDIIANLTVQAGNASNASQIGFLLDGAFTENYSTTVNWAYVAAAGTGNSPYHAVTRYHRHPVALSSGNHTVCITAATGSGGEMVCGNATCTLELREVR